MNKLDTEIIYKEISKLSSQEKACLINKLILDLSTEIKGAGQLDIYNITGEYP
ncbi:MAG: hypothetical protein ACMUIA_07330 [bacterium]